MYYASAVYIRRRLTFTAIFFGKTDWSIGRFLQPEKRLRDESYYYTNKYKMFKAEILIEVLCRIAVRTSMIWPPSSYAELIQPTTQP